MEKRKYKVRQELRKVSFLARIGFKPGESLVRMWMSIYPMDIRKNATRQPGTIHPSDSKYKDPLASFPENIIYHLLPLFGNFQHTQISHVTTPLNLRHVCQ
jgi:hypothetical protein